jgi:hypothetical protein
MVTPSVWQFCTPTHSEQETAERSPGVGTRRPQNRFCTSGTRCEEWSGRIQGLHSRYDNISPLQESSMSERGSIVRRGLLARGTNNFSRASGKFLQCPTTCVSYRSIQFSHPTGDALNRTRNFRLSPLPTAPYRKPHPHLATARTHTRKTFFSTPDMAPWDFTNIKLEVLYCHCLNQI